MTPINKANRFVKHGTVMTFLALVLISVFSCSSTQVTEESKAFDRSIAQFELDKSDFVVLPFQEDWHWIFENVKPAELSQGELIEIEELIKLVIEENNKSEASELINHNEKYPNDKWKETGFELKLKGYKRQYVPVINKNGGKEIWINFFCDDWGSDDWRSGLIEVSDGGSCYFNLKIDLTNKSYSELRINGYA